MTSTDRLIATRTMTLRNDVNELASATQSLARSLMRMVETLDEALKEMDRDELEQAINRLGFLNSLGEIQGRGPGLDVATAKVRERADVLGQLLAFKSLEG